MLSSLRQGVTLCVVYMASSASWNISQTWPPLSQKAGPRVSLKTTTDIHSNWIHYPTFIPDEIILFHSTCTNPAMQEGCLHFHVTYMIQQLRYKLSSFHNLCSDVFLVHISFKIIQLRLYQFVEVYLYLLTLSSRRNGQPPGQIHHNWVQWQPTRSALDNKVF